MKMRVRYRYPKQKVLGLYNVPVSRLDEMASVLARAFNHDKGPIDGRCNRFSYHQNLIDSRNTSVYKLDSLFSTNCQAQIDFSKKFLSCDRICQTRLLSYLRTAV